MSVINPYAPPGAPPAAARSPRRVRQGPAIRVAYASGLFEAALVLGMPLSLGSPWERALDSICISCTLIYVIFSLLYLGLAPLMRNIGVRVRSLWERSSS